MSKYRSKISSAPKKAMSHGSYTVSRIRMIDEDPTVEYLHTDGVWRESTESEDGYTGYFRGKITAEKALAQDEANA